MSADVGSENAAYDVDLHLGRSAMIFGKGTSLPGRFTRRARRQAGENFFLRRDAMPAPARYVLSCVCLPV